jgi:hypothetical protein
MPSGQQCCRARTQRCQCESKPGSIKWDSPRNGPRIALSATPPSPCAVGAGKIVDRPVGLLVAQNGLDVFARLRERNGLHKLVDARIRAGGLPIHHAIVARVVGGQRVLLHAAEVVEHLAQIARSQADVHLRVEQLEGLEMVIPSSRAIFLPTEGSNCISPYALA